MWGEQKLLQPEFEVHYQIPSTIPLRHQYLSLDPRWGDIHRFQVYSSPCRIQDAYEGHILMKENNYDEDSNNCWACRIGANENLFMSRGSGGSIMGKC